MYAALSAIRLGFDVPLAELVDLAIEHRFAGVEPSARSYFHATQHERDAFGERIARADLSWRLSALPGNLGTATSDDAFIRLIAEVKSRAPLLRDAGAVGFSTWISPASDDLTHTEQLSLHHRRLDAIAPILRDNDLRLGLEYVGPTPSRAGRRYPFIHTLAETRDLIDALDDPGAFGLVLDTMHWHTAGETTADLLSLDPSAVLAVDVNDALAGIDRSQQTDELRAMPCVTGVIDARSFVEALKTIGVAAPLVAEPLERGVVDIDVRTRVRLARSAVGGLLGEPENHP